MGDPRTQWRFLFVAGKNIQPNAASSLATFDRSLLQGWTGYDPMTLPICSMYGIFTNIYPKNHPNVGKYTIHGAYGLDTVLFWETLCASLCVSDSKFDWQFALRTFRRETTIPSPIHSILKKCCFSLFPASTMERGYLIRTGERIGWKSY